MTVTPSPYARKGKAPRPSGNIVPLREVPDDGATRATGALPPVAWELLDLARAAGLAARLTWCVGWTRVIEVRPDALPGSEVDCEMSGEASDERPGDSVVCPGCETKRKVRIDGTWPKHGFKGGRHKVDRATHSLVLRVRGLLWVGWENVVGQDAQGRDVPRGWTPVRGQLLGPDRIIRQCTQTAARRLLKATKERAA